VLETRTLSTLRWIFGDLKLLPLVLAAISAVGGWRLVLEEGTPDRHVVEPVQDPARPIRRLPAQRAGS
jgi:hypothetical protein